MSERDRQEPDEERQARQERMREQALALAQDPDDLAEIRRVREDMESDRAW